MPRAAPSHPTSACGQTAAPARSRTPALLAALESSALVVAAVAACAGLHAALVRSAVQADAWYTLLAGRAVSTDGLPHRETLTAIAAGRRWVDQQWLAQLGLYRLWAVGGWPAVLLFVVVAYAAAFSILAGSARLRGASDRSVALVLVACFLTGLPNTVLRAQVPAYVLFALVFALLLGERPSRRIYLTLPLLAVWANVHGSVVLGAGLVALRGLTLAAGGIRDRAAPRDWLPRSAILALAPWLCLLASPYGLALPGYYRRVLDNSTLTHVASEWGPSTFRGQPLFFALLLVGAWLAGRSRRSLTPFATLALAGSALLGLLAIRNIVWCALVAAAVLPRALDAAWPPAPALRRGRLNLALGCVAVVFAVVVAVVSAGRGRGWFEQSYPAEAAAAVSAAARADPNARIFADERYADWLLFEDPSLAGRIAYDIRYELLTSRELTRIADFRHERGAGWERAAGPYRLLVLDPRGDAGAVRLFEGKRGTRVLYRGPDAVVLGRAAG